MSTLSVLPKAAPTSSDPLELFPTRFQPPTKFSVTLEPASVVVVVPAVVVVVATVLVVVVVDVVTVAGAVGVTASLAAEAVPVPAELVALTVKL